MTALASLQSVFNSAQLDVLEQWINNRMSIKIPFGNATMDNGIVEVAFEDITDDSVVILTSQFALIGSLFYTITPGIGFTINSTDSGDSGVISYIIHL